MTLTFRQLETIDDVVAALDRVIDRCVHEQSKLGYFAALYRSVTARVGEAILAGRFEDARRLERLDVIFATRYLEAIESYWRGEAPTRSWSVAFDACQAWPPIILQHLLLGMNAHINLDLAIAAAVTAPGHDLPGLQRDFNEITFLLNEMILDVQTRIERVSPWFWVLDRVGGRTDEQLCAFAMHTARLLSWRTAQRLVWFGQPAWEPVIGLHDQVVAALGRQLTRPSLRLRAALLLIRAREVSDVPRVILALRD